VGARGAAGNARGKFLLAGFRSEIQGKRSSYYLAFDDKFSDEKRVEQIIAWLKLRPDLRPHFITYTCEYGPRRHTFGPEAPEPAKPSHVDK